MPAPSGTLIYDGDCGFCTSTAMWAKNRLSDDYRVVAWQALNIELFGLTEADVTRSAWWVEPDGCLHQEHHCIAKALRAMHGPWPLLASMLTLAPISPLARYTYRLIARNRHRMPRFGRPKTCQR